MLLQLHGFVHRCFFPQKGLPPLHLQRFSLSAVSSKVSLNPDEVPTPFLECPLYPTSVYHLQPDHNLQEGKKLILSSQCVLQGMVNRRQQYLNLGTAPSTSIGSGLKSGLLSPKLVAARDKGPALTDAFQQSLQGGDQIGITVPLVSPTERGHASNAENARDTGSPA